MPVETLTPTPEGQQPLVGQVLDSLNRHLTLMGLVHWWIKVTWTPILGEFAMQTQAEPEYYKALIDVDLESLKPAHIDAYIRHELFHVLLWQYSEAAAAFALKRTKATLNKLEERTVSDLERMPLWEKLSSI